MTLEKIIDDLRHELKIYKNALNLAIDDINNCPDEGTFGHSCDLLPSQKCNKEIKQKCLHHYYYYASRYIVKEALKESK